MSSSQRQFRCPDDVWERFAAACAAEGTSPSAVLRGAAIRYARTHGQAEIITEASLAGPTISVRPTEEVSDGPRA